MSTGNSVDRRSIREAPPARPAYAGHLQKGQAHRQGGLDPITRANSLPRRKPPSSATVITWRCPRPLLEGMAEACRIAETERSSDVIGAQQGRFQVVFCQRVSDACQEIVIGCALRLEFPPEGTGRHAQRRSDRLDIGETPRRACQFVIDAAADP